MWFFSSHLLLLVIIKRKTTIIRMHLLFYVQKISCKIEFYLKRNKKYSFCIIDDATWKLFMFPNVFIISSSIFHECRVSLNIMYIFIDLAQHYKIPININCSWWCVLNITNKFVYLFKCGMYKFD